MRESLNAADKALAALAGTFPHVFRTPAAPADPGVILFTSGSFGAPRGVVLSQANLAANVEQIASHIALDPDWVMFNPLPTFHCFGLTGGVLLPILSGMKAFQYPSPLHVKQIPPLVRDTGASILLATDTFVNQYARTAEPGDLSGLRFVVCGAERVHEETHNLIASRFGGVPVVEGYGATEAAPVIAVNRPEANKRGTVGDLVPGMEIRIEPVEGISGGGQLFVRGPNVMAGYLDDDGRVGRAEGRLARHRRYRLYGRRGLDHHPGPGQAVRQDRRRDGFADRRGEPRLRRLAGRAARGHRPARSRKGERLVLVTDRLDAQVAALVAHARAIGAPELIVPSRIVRVRPRCRCWDRQDRLRRHSAHRGDRSPGRLTLRRNKRPSLVVHS